MRAFVLAILAAIIFSSCSEKKRVEGMTDEQLRAYADELAHKFIITDGHVDLPYRLKENGFSKDSISVIQSTKRGEFDYDRAVKGGLDAPFMSIYIPSSYQRQPDYGKALADSLIDMVNFIAQSLPDKFALAKTPADVEVNTKAGKISLPMGMENGAPIGDDLKNVQYFYDRGIRYITLTHSKNNQICDSSGDSAKWNGLSPFGKKVVEEMNRVGIMVDISHVDDSTFYQVMKLSKAPCIASHSSCRYFAPMVRRDMTDDMIKKMGENNGVIQINFYTAFIDSALANYNAKKNKVVKELVAKQKDKKDKGVDPKTFEEQYKKDHPVPQVSIELVADHIDHIKQLIGVDHVAIGSDYDGVDGNLPTGLKDVSAYPNLIYTLLKRGYTEEDIEKICYKNVWRVWSKVEEVAKASK